MYFTKLTYLGLAFVLHALNQRLDHLSEAVWVRIFTDVYE